MSNEDLLWRNWFVTFYIQNFCKRNGSIETHSCFLDGDLDNWDVSSLSKEQRDIIEADSFWCLSKFLDGIQDNYIFAQLGIQHKVNQLKELIQRIDGKNWMKQNINLHTLFKGWDFYGIKDWYFILVGCTVISCCEPFVSAENFRHIKEEVGCMCSLFNLLGVYTPRQGSEVRVAMI